MGGVESWDRLDGNSRLSLDGHTFHSLVCSVSSVQTSCIWPTPVSVAFHLPACGYTCYIKRGSRYFGGNISELGYCLVANKNAAAPPSSRCHCLSRASTSWLWGGLLAKSWYQTTFWSVSVRLYFDSNLQAVENYFATSTPSLLAALLGFPKKEKVPQDRIGKQWTLDQSKEAILT